MGSKVLKKVKMRLKKGGNDTNECCYEGDGLIYQQNFPMSMTEYCAASMNMGLLVAFP